MRSAAFHSDVRGVRLITERKRHEQAIQELSGRLINAQEQERAKDYFRQFLDQAVKPGQVVSKDVETNKVEPKF